MSTWTHFIFVWLADYYTLATAILLLALLAGALVRQPIKRYSVTAGAVVGLIVLAILSATPLWPRLVFIGKSNPAPRERPIDQFATVNASPIELKTPIGITGPMVSSAKPQAKAGPPAVHPASPPINRDGQIAPSRQIDYAELATATFITVAGIVSIWLTIGALRIRKLCRLAERPPEFAIDELNKISLSFRERAGVRGCRYPRLLVSRLIDVAAACGLLRPTILLPSNAVQESGVRSQESAGGTSSFIVQHSSFASSLRMLLAHEWAHIRRGDLWLLAASRLLLVVLFAHPLYWLLRRQLRFDQELLADTEAAQLCGRQEYAECLFAWARQLPARRLFPAGALGIWNRPGQLSRRIAMLLDERIRLQSACSRLWKIAVACAATLLVVGISFVTLQPAPLANAATPIAKNDEPKTIPSASIEQPEQDRAKTAPVAQVGKVSVLGTCVDEQKRPIPNAHVRLFRIDHSDEWHLKPEGRMKWLQTTIPGAEAYNAAVLTSGSSSGTQRLLGETHTDKMGRFEFADLPADEGWRSQKDMLQVVAKAPGMGTEFYRLSLNDSPEKQWVDPVHFKLQNAATLKGRITNANGQPVADAIVSCSQFNFLVKPVPGILCAVTNADGRYEIDDIVPFDANDYPPQVTPFGAIVMVSAVATVEHPDYAQGIIEFSKLQATKVHIPLGQASAEYTRAPATIDHVLQRPATLHGHVVLDESGQPADEARVNWTHENGLSWGVRTDKNGEYSLPQLSPGKYKIEVIRQDRLTTSQEITLDSGEHLLDLRLKRGGHIQGKVVDDATGKVPPFDRSMSIQIGAYNIQVITNGQTATKQELAGRSCQGWVNEDGSFLMSVVPGHNLLSFLDPNWQFADPQKWNQKGIDVADGQTVEVDLRLKPRRGGWAAVSNELATIKATAKGEPAPAPPSPPAEPPLQLGNSNEDALFKSFLEWPDELLPKQPLSKKAMFKLLEQDNIVAIERKNVRGNEEIVSIQLGDVAPTDGQFFSGQLMWLEYSVLAHIDAFPYLETLGMMGGPGDDKWLEPLRGNKHLKSVMFAFSKNLTAKGLEHLATLPNLTEFVAMGLKLDDRALREIAKFPKLQMVQCGGVFTDDGVRELRGKTGLKQLGIVTLGDSQLTDRCLRDIGTLTNLEGLGLMSIDGENPQSQITDDGLAELAVLTKLESLTLNCPKITNGGLIHLRELKKLKHLDLKGTAVTQEGIDELKKSLPKLNATGYRGWKPSVPKAAAKPGEEASIEAPPEHPASEPKTPTPVTAKAGGAIQAK